jgi:hypothetical protein
MAAKLDAFHAVDGLLGPRPTQFLARGAELETTDGVLLGACEVAAAVRELSAGARDIRLEVAEGYATAVWSVAGVPGRRVAFEFEIDDGVVTRMRARRLDVAS